ncbi:MAG: hypothetical protein J0H67_13075 [Rhodospirillales bacterium]|nr:hypothetical protein [Rhodospirillales bacterium]MBN8897484.1 hypothetical protein [Rhodospirillales bacterium]
MRPTNLLRAAMLAAPVCLAACAAPPPPAPAPKPAAPADLVDGEYRGTSTRFQADSRSCPRPGLVTLIIWDNKFQYHWNREIWLDAVVGPDDLVTGQGPGISMQGRRTGNRIEGDVTDGTCGFHFTVTKRGS